MALGVSHERRQMNRRIAVFGCGFVGNTVANFLLANGVDVIKVDPKLYPNNDPLEAIYDSDGIIICVPTPSGPTGSCDDRIVQEVLTLIDARTKVLLKSTVTPDLIQNYDVNVIYNPEFLREASATEDFMNQPVQIFGHHAHNKEDAEWWADMFTECHTNSIETVFTNRRTASMIKYVHNAWLGTKVAWFHELYKNLPPEVNYSDLINTLGMFGRIGNSHMSAPNSEGKLGYGGSCFPKDLKALTKVVNHSILKEVILTNSKLSEE